MRPNLLWELHRVMLLFPMFSNDNLFMDIGPQQSNLHIPGYLRAVYSLTSQRLVGL